MKKQILTFLFVMAGISASDAAYAVTECTVTLSNVAASDDGYLLLSYEGGGSAWIAPDDPDKQAILGLAAAALIRSKSVRIVYEADSVDCTEAGRRDVRTFYLNR